MLVGSAQGGVTAAEVAAADHDLVIDHVVTAGAPSAQVPRIPRHTRVLSLEDRSDPIALLGSLINASSSNRLTVVFDGAERVHGLPAPPRGVRVLFSRKGETADEVIRRLVRAEPPGRPIVVVSSDREVADGVRRHGAYPMNSESLVRRLTRT